MHSVTIFQFPYTLFFDRGEVLQLLPRVIYGERDSPGYKSLQSRS
jgi:hypothetical protein